MKILPDKAQKIPKVWVRISFQEEGLRRLRLMFESVQLEVAKSIAKRTKNQHVLIIAEGKILQNLTITNIEIIYTVASEGGNQEHPPKSEEFGREFGDIFQGHTYTFGEEAEILERLI